MRFIAIILITFFMMACASHNAPKNTLTKEQENALFQQGFETLARGLPSQAITDYFDPLIAHYEASYEGKKIYCARTQQESAFYLKKAAQENSNAEVIEQNWAQIYFLKAYAYVELDQADEAEVWLQKALALSPVNASYLAELAHVHQMRKEWDKSIELFSSAEKYAETFAPDEVKKTELLRSKRGIAFALVELGKLDEAERKYKECLAIDAEDQKSKEELRYIKKLRAKSI